MSDVIEVVPGDGNSRGDGSSHGEDRGPSAALGHDLQLLGLDDVSPGRRIVGQAITVTEYHVLAFAGLTLDFTPFHVDATAAASSPFGERIAHGLLTLSLGVGTIADRLRSWDLVAALGVDLVRFRRPVYLGQTIAAVATVTSVRPVGHDRGVVTFDVVVTVEDGSEVLTGELTVMLRATRIGEEAITEEIDERFHQGG